MGINNFPIFIFLHMKANAHDMISNAILHTEASTFIYIQKKDNDKMNSKLKEASI